LEEGTGIALDAREFGACCAGDTGVDTAFHLVAPTDAERSRAVGSYFWPRGASVDQPGGEVDAFGLLPGTDRPTLREALGPNADVIVISDWDDEVRAEVHRALVDGDVVELAFSPGAERLARRVVLDLQEIPVETGALLVHPAVVGVSVDGAQGTIVSASLGEAL
jgi:hypothetical protein